MTKHRNRLPRVERLEAKQLLAADLLASVPADPAAGESYDNCKWFVADSFSFGVEREMKESGEKGGTTDINIGVGELQECTISKGVDMASINLAQFATNGNSPGRSEIDFVEVGGGDPPAETSTGFKKLATDGLVGPKTIGAAATDEALAETTPICYLRYKLDRCFVKSWSTSGDADDRPGDQPPSATNR